jgi:hypothetical protein
VGEQYNDNIFFRKDKEGDFVTVITPTLSLYYAPTGQGAPTANLNISPSGQIYANHSDLNGFGFNENSAISGAYAYQYSPRLTFSLSDSFSRQGNTRLANPLDAFQVPATPTTPPPTQVPIGAPPGPSGPGQDLRNFVSRGDQLTNNFSFNGTFLYRPDISIHGGYSNTYNRFIQQGGSDWIQTFSIRGVYNWKQEHNLHAGYSVSYNNSRNGDAGLIHNFDFGDDYFTSQVYKIDITPTLSLSGSTGLSINTGSSGPRVANNTSLTITKLWETASFAAGLRKGLTPSFGISGISDTTTFFSTFSIRLAERVSGHASADYSYYDTDDVTFRTFQATAGVSYGITTWLSSSLTASYRFINSGRGATGTDLLSRGNVDGTTIFLNLTARFDLWPNLGLARDFASPALSPVLRTPFPTAPPASTPTSTPPSASSGAPKVSP